MKRLIVLLTALMSMTSLLAEEKEIKMQKELTDKKKFVLSLRN